MQSKILRNIFMLSCYSLNSGENVILYLEIALTVEAFNSCKTTLLHGLQYHDQLSRLQEAESTVRELIT